jgi:hypothetical protein
VFLDFLSARPEATNVKGVGSGLLHQLCGISRQLRAGSIWGETTAESASFYSRAFGLREVGDRLLVTMAQQEVICQDLEALWRARR